MSYGKKVIKNSILGTVALHTETRDSICYDVIPAQRVARVKIQGSSILIIVQYPQSWQVTPSWLRPGASVTIRHTGGIRGRLELLGPGNYIPTPVQDDTYPPAVIPGDAVLTGLGVLFSSGMTVSIAAGTYRLGGLAKGYAGGTQLISNGSSTPGYFRYDLLSIGAAGTITYTEGTASATPVVPAVPTDEVEVGRILVAPDMTTLSQPFIGRTWEDRAATHFIVTAQHEIQDFATQNNTITLQVLDQYDVPLSGTWSYTIQITQGNGSIGGTAAPGVHSGSFSGTQTTLTYARSQLPGDLSPVLTAELTVGSGFIEGVKFIELLNQSGDPAIGQLFDPIFTLTSGATIAVDWTKYKTQRVVLSHAAAFSFSGGSDGDKLLLMIREDGDGGYTPTMPGSVAYSADMPTFLINTNAGKLSFYGFIYSAWLSKYCLVSIAKGY